MPKKNEKQQPSYPVQPPLQQPVLYPTQPMYNPMMQAQPPYNPAMQGPYTQGMPAPPPSYEQSLNHPVAPNNYVPNQQWVPPGQMPAGAPYYGAPQQQPVMYTQSPYQQQQQVQVQPIQGPATFVVPGGFDAGARFNSTSQARIPPPPPGIAPNVAQVAAASGHNVVIGQRPDNYLTGGSSGGMTFW